MNDRTRALAWLRESLAVDARSIERLEVFVERLVDENRKQNLVSPVSLEFVWWRHIVDSAQLLLVSRETPRAGLWLDLGTGAGFPGLIIAVLDPSRAVLLVEERKRRSGWLESIADELKISNAEIHGGALEALSSTPAGVISARAFAPLPKLLGLSARFSTPETLWLLPKGATARQEVDGLPQALRRMFHVEPSHTSSEAGIIVGRGRIETKGVRVC